MRVRYGMMSPMSLLSKLLQNLEKGRTESHTTETVRKISEELDKLDQSQARYIACFAYLLSRVAGADMTVSRKETRRMEEIVAENSGLPLEQAVLVVQIAKTQNLLFGGTENFLVAREFRDMSSLEERLGLLDCLFSVAASHELVSTIEDNEISQIADELRIEHRDFIAIRSRYREYLSVLKKES
jgi:uncharacterized tellurite resistance protein B-like protein